MVEVAAQRTISGPDLVGPTGGSGGGGGAYGGGPNGAGSKHLEHMVKSNSIWNRWW